MSPSDRYKVIAIYEIMKMLNFHRVSTISGPIYTEGAKSFFHELIKRDLENGTYPWTILSHASIGFGSMEDYVMVADTLKKRDSRINMMALPEFLRRSSSGSLIFLLLPYKILGSQPYTEPEKQAREVRWRATTMPVLPARTAATSPSNGVFRCF